MGTPTAEALVLADATVATMSAADQAASSPGHGLGYGLIHDAAVVLEAGRLAWVGPRSALPGRYRHAPRRSVEGRLITPGLVECSTHLIFAGDRRDEFAARISSAGPVRHAGRSAGIRNTVADTVAAADEDLLAAAERRAWWFIRQGVTTLEVKTGYGLSPEAELRLLRTADQLRLRLPIRVRITLLAGHTYPDTDHEDYVIDICDNLLPAAMEQGIVDQVEVYCEETVGLSMEHASTILETVYRAKMPTRVSADHLSDSAGGALAPAFYAKAALHLTFTDDVAVKAMGRAGTTAVLVPGWALELAADRHRPPLELLRSNHVPLALSTDLDPGTSPLADLRTAAHLGCVLYGLTMAEALHGITTNAARALALDDGTGTLVAGGPGDLAVWDAEHPEELVYWVGAPTCQQVWSSGSRVYAR